MLTQHTATREDLGPAINVVTWFLGAMAFLAVLARTVTKRILSRIAADDYLVVAALVRCHCQLYRQARPHRSLGAVPGYECYHCVCD